MTIRPCSLFCWKKQNLKSKIWSYKENFLFIFLSWTIRAKTTSFFIGNMLQSLFSLLILINSSKYPTLKLEKKD